MVKTLSWAVLAKLFRCTDEPCYACGTPIKRIKIGGRSTHYCPRCQR